MLCLDVTFPPMSFEPISVRDFLRNFSAVVDPAGKKKYLIMKHGRPIGMFTPWGVVKKETLKGENLPLEILERF